MDFTRLRQGEIVAGAAGMALIVVLFLPWYSLGIDAPEFELPELPGIDTQSLQPDTPDDDISGWDALTDFDGFLIALAGLAGVAFAVLAAAGRRVNLGGLPRGAVTAALGALATVLVLWRMFAQPLPGAELEEGIFLGFLAAAGVTYGGLASLRQDGFQPLLAAAGPRSKAGSSARSKPAAKPKAKPGAGRTRKRAAGK